METQTKIQICHDDFYLMMRNAVIASGGKDDVEKWKKMDLIDIVGLFAQNGLRVVYMPDKHMNSLQIQWKAKPSGNREDGPLSRRQLLTDVQVQQREDGAEELNK